MIRSAIDQDTEQSAGSGPEAGQGSRNGRKRNRQRELRILEAALELFGQKGFEATTVSAICEAEELERCFEDPPLALALAAVPRALSGLRARARGLLRVLVDNGSNHGLLPLFGDSTGHRTEVKPIIRLIPR